MTGKLHTVILAQLNSIVYGSLGILGTLTILVLAN